MSYLVLARKWRPQGFEDLVGQEHVATVLKNSISQEKVVHAYVFSGPRGVGKTSTARILAKALNCKDGPTSAPCGSCAFCKSISDGSSVDVMEIDGASNNSVNDVRELREGVKYAPSGGRYKLYIIDEAHMLSDSAFNALLKTIEEPPPHVVFVLATTRPRKIPLTVMSRCQHLPFRKIPSGMIVERLKSITGAEGIRTTGKALDMIASASEGSMRDSLTILDQAASFSEEIDESSVSDLLGITGFETLFGLTEALFEGKRPRILSLISEASEKGTDLKSLAKDLVRFMRDLLVAKTVSSPEDILECSPEEMSSMKKLANLTSEDILLLYLNEMVKAEQDAKDAFAPRLSMEMSLLKASYLNTLKPVKDIIKDIEKCLGRMPEGPPAKKYEDALEESDDAPAPFDSGEESHEEVSLAGVLLEAVITGIQDQRLRDRLSKARPELDGETLTLFFARHEAELFSGPIQDNLPALEKLASDSAKKPLKIRIEAEEGPSQTKKDSRKNALSEPIVKEAMDLFEGRVVDIRTIND